MTRPDPSAFDAAAEADVVEQSIPVDDVEDDGVFSDAQRVSADRDWQANEADLLEQAIDVPVDDADFDR
ncbi:hypothetical protein [Mycobacterium sp. SMC-4]|uniref:hypothetical protein n=1 Tax=Mycobacterium sp. SMC-4 TaxID=2857059 RepID=UPI0021B35A78|nr:hypothetical protein [Mycobacterium sp. SMC-4]UXA16005.1 hypothetical protein KXD98_14110 [Mycobacterium sp. SMC-4]